MASIYMFFPEDYKLEVKPYKEDLFTCSNKYIFCCEINGMPLESFKTYTTEKGAYRAGYNWLKRLDEERYK